LLEGLRPKPEFVHLFRAIVFDVWKQRSAEARTVQADLERRTLELRRMETALDEAYVYEKKIDSVTYERQREKLREDVALARMESDNAKLEEIGVEGVLGFVDHLIANAGRLWLEAPADQGQRLQRVLFPQRLRLKASRIATTVTCLAIACAAVCIQAHRYSATCQSVKF
jgi:hypothetical protein